MTPAKVLFIGLDSADPQLLRRWADAGVLPNIGKLRAGGVSGPALATAGLGSDPLWVSVATGVRPDRHGRYFRFQVAPGEYRADVFYPDQVHVPGVWTTLSRAGRRCAIIDLPYMPPVRDLNGIQLVDWMVHDPQYEEPRCRSWPPELASEVAARFGTDPVGSCDMPERSVAEFRDFRDRMLRRIERKTAYGLDVLGQGPWDLMMINFPDAHCVAHQCWHIHEPGYARHDAAARQALGDPVQDIYAALDRAVGELVRRAGDRTTAILFAGPGMEPDYTGNHLLDEILRRREQPQTGGASSYEMAKTLWRKLPKRVRIRFRWTAIGADEAMLERMRRNRQFFVVPHNEMSGAVRINLAGREPSGMVQPGAACDEAVAALRRDLMELADLNSGQPVVAEVVPLGHQRPDAASPLPDLLVRWRRDAGPIEAIGSPRLGEFRGRYPGNRTGDHSAECMFVASGPDIGPVALNEPISVTDFAPTIGSLLDVPLPDLDGRPIRALVAG